MASEARDLTTLPRRLIQGCRSFRARLVLRVLLLGATLWLLFHTTAGGWGYPAATVAAAGLLLYQVFGLVRFVDRTNRELARFLAAIRYADFSQTFGAGGLGSSFDELKTAFNEVLDAFRLARAGKEEQARYLQTVVQHIGVGLLVFDGGGRVSLINNAAKRLLGVPRLGEIAALARVSPGLAATLKNLGPRGRDLVRFGETQLALHASVFRTGDREHTLVALQDIGPDLDEKETEAWHNLIRVLTHEIMNSITPIASLAATADRMLKDGGHDGETAGDIRTAVGTIQRRSEGLLQFVETYRGLTRVPEPSFEIVPVAGLFARVEQLLGTQFAGSGVELHTRVDPPGLELTGDPGQVEQVLINLLSNAREATEGGDGGRVDLSAHLARGKVVVEVADNGPGIVEEALGKLFIPFFTTKQNGSGIGLSLCRQIMRLHRGSISVRSQPGERTVFSLRF